MRGGLRIGKLHGIDLVVDWSWSLVFLLMSWNLTVVFQQWHPSWPLGGRVLLAVVATLLFFASLVTHELAHSLVAQAYGMKVREIRIFLFGGVANIEREPPTPGAELAMAIVGPFTSIGLGIMFFGLSGLAMPRIDPTTPLDTLAKLGPLATLFYWLGPINVLVGLFNLLPAFPLDGGRVFRAAMWWATGSMHKATAIATSFGRAIGWAFVVVGVAMVFGAHVPVLGGGAGNGIWLAFIGWFLKSAAVDTARAQVVYEALDGVRVGDLMRRTGPTVPASARAQEIADGWFLHSDERAFPVMDGGRLVGVVSIGDLRRLPRDRWAGTSVLEIMTPLSRLAVAGAGMDAQAALRTILANDIHQLPVMDGDVLVGMLFGSDIMRWIELHTGATRRPIQQQLST